MPTAKPSKLSSVPLMVAVVACALAAGCGHTTVIRNEARPVEAKLEIYTVDPKTGERKWITQRREIYRYEEEANDQRGPAQED